MPTFGMTDQSRVNALLQALFTSSTACVITPGTGGGSALTATPPYHLRLMTAMGSNTVNGTEATAVNCPGYTAGGSTLGSQFCAAPAGGVQANANVVSWSATGTWTTVPGIEVWDTAATPLRWLQGTVSSPVTGVVNGDSIIFAAAAVTTNAASWLTGRAGGGASCQSTFSAGTWAAWRSTSSDPATRRSSAATRRRSDATPRERSTSWSAGRGCGTPTPMTASRATTATTRSRSRSWPGRLRSA